MAESVQIHFNCAQLILFHFVVGQLDFGAVFVTVKVFFNIFELVVAGLGGRVHELLFELECWARRWFESLLALIVLD